MSRRTSVKLAVAERQSTALSPEVLEERRQAVIAQAVEAAPQVLKAVVQEALSGDMKAARLVLEVAGVTQRPGPGMAVQVNQVAPLITPEELAELERDLREWEQQKGGRMEN